MRCAGLAGFARRWYLGALLALLCLPAGVLAQAPLSDPTAPVHRMGVGGAASAPLWTLQSTLIGPQRRVAVINGIVVREGAVIDGAVVVSIDYASVLLKVDGRRLHLRLFGADPVSVESRGNP